MHWFALFRPGDWLIIVLSGLMCAVAFPVSWNGGIADKAVIRREGEIFAVLDLSRNRQIDVPGPLGTTAIAVQKHRVRVISDPGTHQYCVRQGWLERTGEIAICAPNQVSIQIVGRQDPYDSLNY